MVVIYKCLFVKLCVMSVFVLECVSECSISQVSVSVMIREALGILIFRE